MNRILIFGRLFFFVPILLLGSSIVEGQNRNTHTANKANAIRALDNRWLTAYDRGDAEAIRKIFADEAQMIHSDGRVTTKLNEMTNVKAIPPELKANWRAEKIEVRFYGGTAVSSGIAIQEGQYADQQFARQYRYTNVYVRRKKQWLLVSAQYSRIENR